MDKNEPFSEFTEEEKAEFAEFDTYEVTYDKKEKPEQFLFSWCGKKFIQLGKLNGITAIGASKVAAGKSMLCNLFMAASLVGEIYDKDNSDNKLKCLVKNCISLYVDAEMGRSSTQTAIYRIRLTCEAYGYPSPYRWKQRTKSISVDYNDPAKLMRAIRYYIAKIHPNVVYVDNMVFVLDDMDVNGSNSPTRIAELDSWCKKYDTTIVLVAHGNKSAEDANIAGVAGTAVMRITSYILAVTDGAREDDPLKFKKVVTSKARQGGFDGLPDLTFYFIPFIAKDIESVYPVIGRPKPTLDPNDKDIVYFNEMFISCGAETMRYGEIKKYIMKDKGCTDTAAEEYISQARAMKIIVKNGNKKMDPYKLFVVLPKLPNQNPELPNLGNSAIKP